MNFLTKPGATSRLSNGKIALFIILASESIFFVMILVAYVALRNETSWRVDHTIVRLMIPLANTVLLLISAICAWRGKVSIRNGNLFASQDWQLLTLLLGLVFVTMQNYEFSHAGMRINDQTLGGAFFTLMGFHALHVLAGAIFLIINFARTRLGDYSPTRYEAVELGTWFWYYVTGVWILLFAALYLL